MVYSSSPVTCSLYCQGNKKKKDYDAENSSNSMVYGELTSSLAVRNKKSVVRIILMSGLVEVHDSKISAYSVMMRYPGLRLARPDVFKSPYESLVGQKEMLCPGEKFYLVPDSTLKKLMMKYPRVVEVSEDVRIEPVIFGDERRKSDEMVEGSVCYARDFYVSNDRWNKCFVRRVMEGTMKQEKKPFVPPIKKGIMRQGLLDGWKPGLSSIEEEKSC